MTNDNQKQPKPDAMRMAGGFFHSLMLPDLLPNGQSNAKEQQMPTPLWYLGVIGGPLRTHSRVGEFRAGLPAKADAKWDTPQPANTVIRVTAQINPNPGTD